jgi:hypothetical protein
MQYSGITLTPGFIISAATDPQFNYVTALLHGDGTNAGQNNTFLDSSINNFTVTRNGSTTQGSFAPYSTLWSNYFNGSAGYLSVANNAAFDFGTGDCTFEAWVFIQSYSTIQQIVYSQSLTSGPNGYEFLVSSSGFLIMESQASSVDQAITATNNAIPLNTWTHVAFTRASGTNRLFVNGNLCTTTGTLSQAISTGGYPVYIGAYLYSSIGNYYFNGYISNVRLVKGTAVYTSNFTPPTAPLTAITNTSLLTCQSNRFVDNSSNAFAVTVSGTPSVQVFSPFGTTTQYDPNVNGGSGYFNGSTDYLTAPTGTAFQFAGDFTIEAWVYSLSATGQANYSGIFDTRATNSSSTTGIVVNLTPSGYLNLYINGNNYTSATLLGANNWTHVALVRSGSTISMYQNGVSVASVSYATSLSSGYFWVGTLAAAGASGFWQGYISNLRVVNGTAVYTSTFTPPTAPVTAIANTSLLLNGTNGQIFGSSIMNNFVTVGNAQVSTSVYKYGTGSIYFDGTGDWLVPTNLLPLGGGDFTVEMWLYPNATYSGTYAGLLDSRTSADGAGLVYFGYTGTANQIGWKDNTTFVVTGTVTVSTWNHVAVVRSSGTMKMYINGTSTSSAANSTNYTVAFRLIGSSFDPFSLNGYMDELRFTRGFARYTANFTPPTSQFPSTGDITPGVLNYLVVGGGGGGGVNSASGGGAGGLVANTSSFAVGSTYTVTVGAGATAVSSPGEGTGVDGGTGTNSSVAFNNPITYAASFNGTTQYLTTNYSINWSTLGSFTLEFWIYLPSLATNQTFFTTGNAAAGTTGFYIYSTGSVAVGIFGVNEITTATGIITTNQWYHIAYTYNATTTKIYVNGVSRASSTTAVYANNSGNFVIAGANSGPSMTGYLSNIRLSKLVVYTTTFTPPTSPLTVTQTANVNGAGSVAITGVQTALLTLQNATIIDNSTNAYTITNTGSVTTSQTISPLATALAYGGGGGSTAAGSSPGGNGGSGGGGVGTAGAGTTGQGFFGFATAFGGGGGAGAAGGGPGGTGPTSYTGGAGGVGAITTLITTAQATSAAVGQVVSTSVYFAGGGGGSGDYRNRAGGVGGSGGGGTGSSVQGAAGGSGTVNTGGGGAGSSYALSNQGNGGAGGSGVVILSYPATLPTAASTTGSPTIYTTGGYNTYIFKSSGSITF